MKIVALMVAALVMPVVAVADTYSAEWTGAGDSADWNDPKNWSPEGVPTSGVVHFAKGKTAIAGDDAYDNVHKLEKIYMELGATNIFTFAKSPTVTFAGRGHVVKRNKNAWTLTTEQKSFYGGWTFEGGVVTNKNQYGLTYAWEADRSADSLNHNVKVVVEDGAQLVIAASNVSFGQRELAIRGTGTDGDGSGAVVNVCGGVFYIVRLKLAGDATIKSNGPITFPRYGTDPCAYLDTGTFTATFNLTPGLELKFEQTGFRGSGTIDVSAGANVRLTANRDYEYSYTGEWTPGYTRVEDPTFGGFVLRDGTTFTTQFDTPSNDAPIRVVADATVKFLHSHSDWSTNVFKTCAMADPAGTNAWRGPITLEAGALLKVAGTHRKEGDASVRLVGPITGAGSIVYHPTDLTSYGKIWVDCPTNSYTGTTTVGVQSGEEVFLAASNSVPDYSKFALTGGAGVHGVTLPVVEGRAHGWTAAAIARFFREGSFAAAPFVPVTVDSRAAGSGGVTLSGEDLTGAEDSVMALGNSGALALAGSIDRPIAFWVETGTLQVTAHDFTVTNPPSARTGAAAGEVLLEGARGLNIAYPFAISDKYNARTWRVKNGAPFDDCAWRNTSSAVEDFAILIGEGKKGVGEVVLDEGSVVTSKFCVGHASSSSDDAQAVLRVKKGAHLLLMGNAADSGTDALGTTGVPRGGSLVGAYANSLLKVDEGGVVDSYGGMLIGHNYRKPKLSAVLWMKGGTWNVHPHPITATYKGFWNIGYYSSAEMLFQDGASFSNCTVTCFTRSSDGSNISSTTLTVEGTNTVFHTEGIGLAYDARGWENVFNLNGGVFSSKTFWQRYTNGYYNALGTPADKRNVIINANGGTLRHTYQWSRIFNEDGSMRLDPEDPLARKPCDFRVYEKGVTFDIPATFELRLDQPIGAAWGKGLGVDTIPFAPQAGFYAVPRVRVEGDGSGATVFAEVDEAGVLQKLRVTGRGCGYTTMTLKIYNPQTGVDNEIDATPYLADNATTGAFTKRGAGTLTINSTNTWGGATVLKEGTIKLGADGVILGSSTFVFGSGTLNMNGFTLSDGSAFPKKWGVDAAAEGATWTGDFAWPAGASLAVLNEDALTAGDRTKTLVTFGGTVTGTKPELPTLKDSHFVLVWSGNSIRAKRLRGTVITIR